MEKEISFNQLFGIVRRFLTVNLRICLPAYFVVSVTSYENKSVAAGGYFVILIMQIIEYCIIRKYSHFMIRKILRNSAYNIIFTAVILLIIVFGKLDINYYVGKAAVMLLFIPNIAFIEVLKIKSMSGKNGEK